MFREMDEKVGGFCIAYPAIIHCTDTIFKGTAGLYKAYNRSKKKVRFRHQAQDNCFQLKNTNRNQCLSRLLIILQLLNIPLDIKKANLQRVDNCQIY